MANRRMFSKSIVNSSKFLRMVPSARLLYFDLGMAADDDGFCEWYTVIQMTGAKEQDLQILESGGFVKVFDKDVLVIRDWLENNYIQKDRYNPSKYLNVYILDTQVRLGKDRLSVSQSEKEIKKKP